MKIYPRERNDDGGGGDGVRAGMFSKYKGG